MALLGDIFHFLSNSKRAFCKQIVANLIRRCVLRRLIWFCTVCRRLTNKKGARLIWVKAHGTCVFWERLLLLTVFHRTCVLMGNNEGDIRLLLNVLKSKTKFFYGFLARFVKRASR